MWKGRKAYVYCREVVLGKEGRKEKRTEEGKEYLDSKDKGSLCLRTAIFSVERGESTFRHERSRGRIEGLMNREKV